MFKSRLCYPLLKIIGWLELSPSMLAWLTSKPFEFMIWEVLAIAPLTAGPLLAYGRLPWPLWLRFESEDRALRSWANYCWPSWF